MDLFSMILSLALLLNFIAVIGLIFFERKNPSTTYAWLLILILLPYLGLILYLLFGLSPRQRQVFGRKSAADVQKKTQLIRSKMDYQWPELTKTESDLIFQIHFHGQDIVYTKNNHVEVYSHAREKFKALFKAIKEAKHHIHVCYYIIRNDRLGRALVNLLSKKAKEGVEVKLIYDSLGCRRLPQNFFAPLLSAGGTVTNFYPSLININYRNHRKIVVIDGKMGFTGGANVGMEYLRKGEGYSWRDTHIKVTGEAAKSLQVRFLLDWLFAAEEDLFHDSAYFPSALKAGNTGMQIVTSGPDSRYEEIKVFLLKMVYSAKKSIYIQTPYFIPDESFFEALHIAIRSGVDVKIIIPDRPDHPFVFWANRSYLDLMLQEGARGYIYKKGFLHSKVVIVDDKIASVGTANIDVRSFKLNFEINAFIYDRHIAYKLTRDFYNDLMDSQEITREVFEKRGIPSRFKESISRLLSPIL